MPVVFDIISSHRHAFSTGLVTGLTAGQSFLSLRHAPAAPTTRVMRLRHLEMEFITTTAFAAAQEMGFAAYIARSFSVAPSGGTAIAITGNEGKVLTSSQSSVLTGAVSTTGALTVGTRTLDAFPFVTSSFWSAAAGGSFGPRIYGQTLNFIEPGGIILANQEGIEFQSTIAMGGSGVGRWVATIAYDIGLVTSS